MELLTKIMPGGIVSNSEDFMKEISRIAAMYSVKEYVGGEHLSEMKKDRSTLNDLVKQVEQRRKMVKKEYLAPLNAFEQQVKNVLAVIQMPMKALDEKIQAEELKQRQERKAEIMQFYEDQSEITGFCMEGFDLIDRIYDEKWEKSATPKKTWKQAITLAIDGYMKDIATIVGLQEPEVQLEAVQEYQKNLCLQDALALINRRKDERREVEIRVQEELRRLKIQPDVQSVTESNSNYGMICVAKADLSKAVQILSEHGISCITK